MKTNLSLLIWIIVVLLAGCSPEGQVVSPSASTGAPGASGSSGGTSQRATLPAVLALSTQMPAFDGLYFNSDLLVENHGENARILAGLPCGQLLALLSSGEWRLTNNIPLNPQFAGFIPGYALMERNGEYLLLKFKDLVPELQALPGEEQIGTSSPPTVVTSETVVSNIPVGCQVTISMIVPQPIEAHGVEEVQGQALGYPLMKDCLITDDSFSVSMFYEASGDFRAMLQFEGSRVVGEQPVSFSELSLQVFHFPMSTLDFLEQYFSHYNLEDTESIDDQGITYTAGTEAPGMVTITSLVPLAGEIQLDNMVDESGNLQTFKAAFNCGW